MDQEKSKSQLKRDAEALQDLGVKLTQLKPSQLAEIPAPDELLEAIEQYKKMIGNAAKKRQAQFIGKVIRSIENVAEIQGAYDKVIKGHKANSDVFHLIEHWRSRLLSEDKNALTEFIKEYPSADVQQLRQLIRKANAESDQDKNLGAKKALFQSIKKHII